jgi:hypothetical protein
MAETLSRLRVTARRAAVARRGSGLGPPDRTALAAYEVTGDRTQRGDITVYTDFRDGHLRHDGLEKPLTSQLNFRVLKLPAR